MARHNQGPLVNAFCGSKGQFWNLQNYGHSMAQPMPKYVKNCRCQLSLGRQPAHAHDRFYYLLAWLIFKCLLGFSSIFYHTWILYGTWRRTCRSIAGPRLSLPQIVGFLIIRLPNGWYWEVDLGRWAQAVETDNQTNEMGTIMNQQSTNTLRRWKTMIPPPPSFDKTFSLERLRVWTLSISWFLTRVWIRIS